MCVFEVCPTYPVAPCGRDAHHILEEDESSSCVVCVKRLTSVFTGMSVRLNPSLEEHVLYRILKGYVRRFTYRDHLI